MQSSIWWFIVWSNNIDQSRRPESILVWSLHKSSYRLQNYLFNNCFIIKTKYWEKNYYQGVCPSDLYWSLFDHTFCWKHTFKKKTRKLTPTVWYSGIAVILIRNIIIPQYNYSTQQRIWLAHGIHMTGPQNFIHVFPSRCHFPPIIFHPFGSTCIFP
jgi:hypothetical protein